MKALASAVVIGGLDRPKEIAKNIRLLVSADASFITSCCSEPRLALNRTVVLRFRLHLESLGLAAGTIN
jgi:hypothetical protein